LDYTSLHERTSKKGLGCLENMAYFHMKLKTTLTSGAKRSVLVDGSWRLQIPAGPAGRYRLAQLDDYSDLPRKAFLWKRAGSFQVQMRASAAQIPGTWGMGFWNNPFGLAILKGVEMLRLPTLPESVWYFFASPQNHLSFYDHLPAHGSLASTFRSQRRVTPELALATLCLPLLAIPITARYLRKLIRNFVRQDSQELLIDPTHWHDYQLDWRKDRAIFKIDGQELFETEIVPQGPLGFVLWVDNQYAAFPPDGRIKFGSLENPVPAWIEVRNLSINGQSPELG
jgi:hypothetical protein